MTNKRRLLGALAAAAAAALLWLAGPGGAGRPVGDAEAAALWGGVPVTCGFYQVQTNGACTSATNPYTIDCDQASYFENCPGNCPFAGSCTPQDTMIGGGSTKRAVYASPNGCMPTTMYLCEPYLFSCFCFLNT